MTPAEKAFITILSAHAVDSFGWKEEIALIESTLQRASECEKIRDNYSWVKKEKEALEMENKALKDKAQGLVTALEECRDAAKFFRELANQEMPSYGEIRADNALSAFNALEHERGGK